MMGCCALDLICTRRKRRRKPSGKVLEGKDDGPREKREKHTHDVRVDGTATLVFPKKMPLEKQNEKNAPRDELPVVVVVVECSV